jgi:hypothetical protein
MGVSRGTVCLGSVADCSDSKGWWSASMGRNSTFKKRRHTYKVALAVEIRMRAIVTNFVVYHLLHACNETCSLKRI